MDKNVDSEKINRIAQELWNEYEQLIRRLCYKKLANIPQEAEDVVSETYLALLNALHEGKKINCPRTWLYSVTKNLINKKYEELTQRRRRFISLDDTNYYHKLAYEIDMLEPRVTEEKIMELKKEIEDELTTDENNLLDLIYHKKKKQKKIAKKYDTTVNAIKQRNYRLTLEIKKKAHDKTKNI